MSRTGNMRGGGRAGAPPRTRTKGLADWDGSQAWGASGKTNSYCVVHSDPTATWRPDHVTQPDCYSFTLKKEIKCLNYAGSQYMTFFVKGKNLTDSTATNTSANTIYSSSFNH